MRVFSKSHNLNALRQEERNECGIPVIKPLNNSSIFHAALLNTIEQSVIATDLDGFVIYWNRFAELLYGWSAAESLGRSIMELVSPEPDFQAAEAIMARLRRGESWSGEFIARRKDGTLFPIQTVNSPIYDDKKTLTGIVGISQDITERQKTEKALRESEAKYRTLVEQASDGIHTYDLQGNFLEVNSKLCQMLGYSREELLRLNAKDLIPAEDLVADPIRFDELRDGKILLRERRLLRRDGTVFPAEISGKTIQDGVLQAIIRDITERRQAETELRGRENQLRLITDAIPLLISYIDKERRYCFVNRSYTEWFGKTREEILDKHLSEVLGDEAYQSILPEVETVLSGEEVIFERLVPYKSGERFIRVNYIPDIDLSTGEVKGFHAFVQDISESRRAKRLLEAQKQSLELVVKGVPLTEVLTYLAQVVERQADEDDSVIASILLLDEQGRLHNGASPSLPEDYLLKIEGLGADVNVGTCAAAAALGEVVVTTDIGTDPKWKGLAHLPLKLGFRAAWSMPIKARDGQVLGTFGTYFRERRAPTALEQQVVEILARTAALAVERKRDEEALRRSHEELEDRVRERTEELKTANEERSRVLHQLITAQEDERRRLSRDLHDQLGQQLTALRLKLDVLKKTFAGDEKLRGEILDIQRVARQLDSDVDFLAWQMRPSVLDDLGIAAALDDYVRQWSARFNISAEFSAARFSKTHLTREVETNLYRIAQEALNNVCKHARASRVNVLLEPRYKSVVLIIEDNGSGFDLDEQSAVNNGIGLIGMNERAALIQGVLEIESGKGAGTTIYVKVPVTTGSQENSHE